MKKALGLAVMMLFVASSAIAQGTIAASAHDLSLAAWNTTEQNLCEVCHTPHEAVSAVVPLWDRATPAGPFIPYTANSGQIGDPLGVSLACLSCHDGATNLDAYGDNGTGSTPMGAVPGNFGLDLSNDHPVSVSYGGALDMQGSAPIDARVRIFSNGADTDAVECASCHNVHNDGDAEIGGAGSGRWMLAMENTGSVMCLTCHAK